MKNRKHQDKQKSKIAVNIVVNIVVKSIVRSLYLRHITSMSLVSFVVVVVVVVVTITSFREFKYMVKLTGVFCPFNKQIKHLNYTQAYFSFWLRRMGNTISCLIAKYMAIGTMVP